MTFAQSVVESLRGLPPGPLNPILHTLRYREGPHEYYARLRDRYGDMFTVPMIYGNLVVTAHPEGARAIFSADPDLFDNWGAKPLIPFFGRHSMALNNGERHRQIRKVVTPAVGSHSSKMSMYGWPIRNITERRAAAWKDRVVLHVEEETRAISLSVIIRTAFGVIDEGLAQRFYDAVIAYVDPRVNLPFLFPWLRREFYGYGPWARFMRAMANLNDLIYTHIRETRAQGARGDDMLSLMLHSRYEDGSPMTDEDIRDQLVTLLVAGHETSTLGMAWSLYWIHRHPAVLARLRQEIADAGPDFDPKKVDALPYLTAVTDETLRIHPVASDVPRVLRRPLTVMGREIPAGVGVVPSAYLIHHRPELYPDPESFRPERFLDRRYTPFEFLPFGGGARRCIGAAFSEYEMKVALFTILQKHDLQLAHDREIPYILNGFVNAPRGGIPLFRTGPAVLPRPSTGDRPDIPRAQES
jgi:cytochrome P450 family 110